MKRLDFALVFLKLAPTRSKAQEIIAAGDVEVKTDKGWRTIDQPSYPIQALTTDRIRVAPDAIALKYVSRGGLKLEGALKRLALNVQGWRCLDVGISTGGFADCLLQAGAVAIAGVDVGHGQLAAALQAEAKVKLFERVNARDLPSHAEIRDWIAGGVDLCVVDVSFISLRLVLPALAAILPAAAKLLALVKPQFEVGADGLGKDGVVKDPARYADVEVQMLRELEKCGFSSLDYFPSALKGRDGNQEFFVYARRA